MRPVFIIAAVLLLSNCAKSQKYFELLQRAYDAAKKRDVISAKISYTDENENRVQNYSHHIFGDNRNTQWRAIHHVEMNSTYYYDGTNATYAFHHNLKKFQVDTGVLGIIWFREKLGVLSEILLARKTSGVSNKPDAIAEVVTAGNSRLQLILQMPGLIEFNVHDKKSVLLIDSVSWIPLQHIDTVYYLERLERKHEYLDTIYSSYKDADSVSQHVQLWLQSYDQIKAESIEKDAILFPYLDIFINLDFVNHKPPEADYTLFYFYYAGCVACLQCHPFLKSIQEQFPNRLAIVSINPYDKVDRIERYNRINGVTYSSATIPVDYLNSDVGQVVYPSYILYNSKREEAARSEGCYPEFFEHLTDMLSKE